MPRQAIFVVLLILIAPSASAEWVRGALFGADVRALIVDPSNPDRYVLGTSHGEIYVSSDAARTWSNPRGTVQFPGYVIDNLEIDAKGRLWAAGWGLWEGGLLAVSTDGGMSWQRRDEGIEDLSIRAFAVAPQDPRFLIVGGLTGVYRSRDDGRTWQKISDRINVESLAIDPRSANVIYVGTWRQAWRTDDGGKSWKHIAQGMVLDTDVFGINIDRENPDDVWLSTCGWVYSSADRGETWTRHRDGFDNRRIHVVERDVENRECLYAGSVAGLYRTLDRGKSWERISDDRLVINAIAIHPERPTRIVLGTEGDGVYVSEDRGESFERTSRGLHNLKLAGLVVDPRKDGRLYAAVVFGGAASGIYRSDDSGHHWKKVSRDPLPEILSLALHEGDETLLLLGTERGFYWSDDGTSWTRAEPSASPVRVDEIVSFNRTRLFAATSEGVFTSRDGGKGWYRLGDSWERILDVEVGYLQGKPVLFTLRPDGLSVYDGNAWSSIEGAPQGIRLAVRENGDSVTVLVANSRQLAAGTVDRQWRWRPLDLEFPSRAVFHETGARGERLLFFLSNGERHLMISDSRETHFRPTGLPLDAKDVVTVASDPRQPGRLYLATLGSGVLIYQDPARAVAMPHLAETAASYPAGTK